jgi:UDP-2-acetamido-3-amino-2,3-dideoxy-glucuronate N-acetyltransferase
VRESAVMPSPGAKQARPTVLKATKRICVIGAGRWGRNHIRTLNGLGVLEGIVESNPAVCEKLRGEYPDRTVTNELDLALADGFDGFVIATPAETHFELASRVLKSGKPVLVEKPLTLVTDQARKLVSIAEEAGVNLMVGHVLLFHPAIIKIKQMIDGGKIGKLQYLYSNRLNLGTVRTEENILWSFAPHDISIFQHLIGRRPHEVVSRGGAFVQPGIHDSTMTVLTYPGNVVGHIFVSWLHPFKEQRLVVIGSKGMLSFEGFSEAREIRFYEKGIDWIRGEPISRDGATETIEYDAKLPLTAELEYFIKHLDGTPVEIADGRSAVEVLEILEQASGSLTKRHEGTEARRHEEKTAGNFFVHPSGVVDENVSIGQGTKIWHFSHVQSGASIGRDCSIGQNVNIGNNVRIGDGVKIQNNVSVYEGVELQDHVFCGPSMTFTNVLVPRSKYPQKGSGHYQKTLVREGATLGANCTIVCGNTIGRHAFVAAGAVLTKDVPDYAMVRGVPAKQVGWMCECGEKLGKGKAKLACPRCKLKYTIKKRLLFPA